MCDTWTRGSRQIRAPYGVRHAAHESPGTKLLRTSDRRRPYAFPRVNRELDSLLPPPKKGAELHDSPRASGHDSRGRVEQMGGPARVRQDHALAATQSGARRSTAGYWSPGDRDHEASKPHGGRDAELART